MLIPNFLEDPLSVVSESISELEHIPLEHGQDLLEQLDLVGIFSHVERVAESQLWLGGQNTVVVVVKTTVQKSAKKI